MEYRYIDDEEKLKTYAGELKDAGTSVLALDIEGESNLHQYGENLSLVQIYDGREGVIIDPLAVATEGLRDILENRNILKIMYSAQGDRAFLYKNCRIDLLSILDLQAAVNLLDFEKRDLNSVLRQALNVDTGRSKKKFQRYNWNRRPVDAEALQYALEDVIYLFELRDHLYREIRTRGLDDAFILENLKIQNKAHRYDGKPRMFKSRRFRDLGKEGQKRFEQAYQIRDEHARELNLPPHNVFPNDILFELAAGRRNPGDVPYGRRVPRERRLRMEEGLRSLKPGP